MESVYVAGQKQCGYWFDNLFNLASSHPQEPPFQHQYCTEDMVRRYGKWTLLSPQATEEGRGGPEGSQPWS